MMRSVVKIISCSIVSLLFALASCSDSEPVEWQREAKKTVHMLSFDIVSDLRVGSRVVNEELDKIGTVKELISEDSGNRQIIEIEEGYLKYPAAKFKISLDSEGQVCILAYYPDKK